MPDHSAALGHNKYIPWLIATRCKMQSQDLTWPSASLRNPPHFSSSVWTCCRRERPAQKARARQAEAPGHVHRLGDADARPATDHPPARPRHSTSNGARIQRQAVEFARDAQRLADAAGAGAQQARVIEPRGVRACGRGRRAARSRGSTPPRRARSRGRRNSGTSGCRTSGRRRRLPGGPNMTALRGVGPEKLCEAGSCLVVGLGLHDPAAHAVDQQHGADQRERNVVRIAGEIARPKLPGHRCDCKKKEDFLRLGKDCINKQ